MRTRVALLVAASLLFTACSRDEDDDTVSETPAGQAVDEIRIASGSFTVGQPSPEEIPTGTTAAATAFGIADVQLQDGKAVFELFGDGAINYVGRYVDEAVPIGSDATFDVPGTSILQLDLISSPTPERGADRPVLSGTGGGIVSVQTTEPSDGVMQAFIGTSSVRPIFTVTTQENPPALVLAVH